MNKTLIILMVSIGFTFLGCTQTQLANNAAGKGMVWVKKGMTEQQYQWDCRLCYNEYTAELEAHVLTLGTCVNWRFSDCMKTAGYHVVPIGAPQEDW